MLRDMKCEREHHNNNNLANVEPRRYLLLSLQADRRRECVYHGYKRLQLHASSSSFTDYLLNQILCKIWYIALVLSDYKKSNDKQPLLKHDNRIKLY